MARQLFHTQHYSVEGKKRKRPLERSGGVVTVRPMLNCGASRPRRPFCLLYCTTRTVHSFHVGNGQIPNGRTCRNCGQCRQPKHVRALNPALPVWQESIAFLPPPPLPPRLIGAFCISQAVGWWWWWWGASVHVSVWVCECMSVCARISSQPRSMGQPVEYSYHSWRSTPTRQTPGRASWALF